MKPKEKIREKLELGTTIITIQLKNDASDANN
jgi:hypothetical protein